MVEKVELVRYVAVFEDARFVRYVVTVVKLELVCYVVAVEVLRYTFCWGAGMSGLSSEFRGAWMGGMNSRF